MSDADDQDREASGRDEYGGAGAVASLVGIGVCAISLQSLGTVFATIDPALGAAYLVAVRQQEGVDVATTMEFLAQRSRIPATIAVDGERIEPDRIYVGGTDDMITASRGRLCIRAASEPVGHRGTIDTMLMSVAEEARDGAVAVILGGLGSDGTAGVTATKQSGGLSIGEAGTDDDKNGTQGVAGPFGVVDLHIPVDRIAAEIGRYVRNITHVGRAAEPAVVPDQIEAQIAQITTILRNVISHDFHGYKHGTFLRRVHRRLQVLQIDTLDEYIARLRGDRQEVQDLFQDLLIGVTQFFRDPAEFDVLEGEIPRLFEGKEPDEQLRVWVLGCATGEEAYSIAILLREHMATLDRPPRAQIFATDLDARALGLARAGRYSDTIAEHVRADRLARWFVHEGDTYCVSKELREMCIFSPHNVTKDAPFSRIDLLSCRNLLIYLNSDLQDRVIPTFHFSLRPGGVLFLGNSENISRHQKLFAAIDRKNRVFRRLETAARIVPNFPLSPRVRGTGPADFSQPEARPMSRLSGALNWQAVGIADRYSPAYVVIDSQGDVLHFSGRTGRYLEPLAGAATLNLFNLVHRDLRLELRAALHRAVSDARRVELPRLALHEEDRTIAVNVTVEPIGAGDVTALVVLFQEAGPIIESAIGGANLETSELVERLETDLRMTRERLQATIEELESTNEELKSSNEEYQSINEELQSANEEMETSKEELQSVNEELETVNGELAHRVSELGRSNSDLKNLLEATQIATLFLDNNLRVRSFTPSATEIFHLIETDVGRPIDHIVSRVAYPELQADVRRVLKSLVPVQRTVTDPETKRHLAAQVLPYRSIDNYISGVVVTFTDLTAIHQAETALRESEARLQALLVASSEAIYRMSPDWTRMLEVTAGSFLAPQGEHQSWLLHYVPPEEQGLVGTAIAAAIAGKSTFEMEHRIRRSDGSHGWTMSRAVPILDAEGAIVEWFGAASDVTARRDAEDALRESEKRLHSLVEGLPQLVWRAVDAGSWTWASRQWADYTGQPEGQSHGWGWLEPVHPDDRHAARNAWKKAPEQGGFKVDFRIRRASDDSYRWFQTRATPVRDEDGTVLEWIGSSTDIDDLRDLQQRQGVLVAELQHRTRNLIGVVRQMAQKTIAGSIDLGDFRARFRARLDALARVQGLLSRLNEHDRVTFDELLHTELAAHGAEPEQDARVQLDGPPGVRMRSTTVQTLAMALHELATNAVKYGALSQPGARLAIGWHIEPREGERPWLHIDWRETGVAMPPAGISPHGGGQGRELIERALPYQLAARTTYVLDGDGVHCTIVVPFSATTGGAAEGDNG